MEKICQNCKYYNLGKCNNQNFATIITGTTPNDEFVELTESGLLAEYIKESNCDEAYELADIVMERLQKLDYIKKNKKKIWNFQEVDDNEEFLTNFTEIVDNIISSFVMESIRDIEIKYDVSPEFGCRFWE